MEIIKSLKKFSILGIILFSNNALAYNPGTPDSECKPPKFKGLNPPEQVKGKPVPEVEPESEIEFTVSGYADPTTITAFAKNEPLKLNIVDKNSFYQVSANLPAILNGKYARIRLRVKAQGGTCIAQDGWLVKIKNAPEAAEQKKAE
jgi:hypothetical protein